MPASPRFIHLRVHSEHSLLEGAIPVKKLPKLAADMGMPAVALTDTNAMFAALEFSTGALAAGVQPIVGCQIAVAFDPAAPGERPRDPAPVVLLAQSEAGYMNLMKLNTCLYLGEGRDRPQVTLDELDAHGWRAGWPRPSPRGFTSNSSATRARAAACPTRKPRARRALSPLPTRWTCRWSPPTTCTS